MLECTLIKINTVAFLHFFLVTKNDSEQRFGRLILTTGFELHLTHYKYWSNHPTAVCLLQNHREMLNYFMEGKFMEFYHLNSKKCWAK